MTRREDHRFTWCPDGREHAVNAGDLIARSIKSFLAAANVPFDTCWTAIVVPDALDEAGQQILLDSLAAVGFAPDRLHLLPRPIAVALNWCQNADGRALDIVAGEEDEGKPAGRLRVLTMGMDLWEAQSIELRARRQGGRTWLVPIRDRPRLVGAFPELPTAGISIALALAQAESGSEAFGWWSHLFSGDWLNRRLSAGRDVTPLELQILRAVRSSTPPDGLRRDFSQLVNLQPLGTYLFQSGPPLLQVIGERWSQQEQFLGTSSLSCRAVLADGAFTGLRMERGVTLATLAGNQVEASTAGHGAAARGAALAAAAIGHGLPCYRETLLPLDLYVMGRDEYDDPSPQWKPLVDAQTVEAGSPWRTREPVAGLRIHEAQDKLLIPLRRSMRGSPMFRQVGTELAKPSTRDESVRIAVEVKPGQGFARVRIDSVTPGVFSTRLDWRTMQNCDEPKPPPLAYLPGVSRILPDRQMFESAQSVLENALAALEKPSSNVTTDRLRAAIDLLNKWPLAHNVERNRGRVTTKDFMLHYGVIGSEGKLEILPAPGLARGLRNAVGERFKTLLRNGNARSETGKLLLRIGGWFYLAIPDQCRDYLRSQLDKAGTGVFDLSAEDLHAIGLSISAPDDLRRFFPLVVEALSQTDGRPNEWLRAVRNICRFRNHALRLDVLSDNHILQLVQLLIELMRREVSTNNLKMRFNNCLEAFPFLLKRRRYNPDFLAPDSRLAKEVIQFFNRLDHEYQDQLATKFRRVPRATLNLIRMEATTSDLVDLLGVEDD